MAKKSTRRSDTYVAAISRAFAGARVAGLRLISQPVAGSRYRHVTVVWERWAGIPQQERGRMILDGFERAHAKEPWRVLEITLAIGLTPGEAEKLNIKAA